jgi:outer membrane protein
VITSKRMRDAALLATGRSVRAWGIAGAALVVFSATASGETLRGALRQAYKFNPQIEAERANLRATDENVARANSNYRPSVVFQADTGVRDTRVETTQGVTKGTTNPRSYTFAAQQQLFRGFRTINAVNEAEANVRAGRENLRATEQAVLLQAVTAYMNVVRDQAIVQLRENNVRVLSRNLTATQDRFKVGEVTRTDVAQSEARRARAVSDLDLARANLKSSRANYQRVVGVMPGYLQEPRLPETFLPKTLTAARSQAEQESPTVVSSLYLEQAARYAVEQIMGELLPNLNLDGRYSHERDSSPGTVRRDVGELMATLTVPLYQRGEVSARVRQAKHLHVRRIQLIHQARTEAREEVIAAWSQLQASRGQIVSDRSQVSANQIALNGVREEEKVGQRTLLDVLNAEQELLDAQVALASTKRDLIVNAYRVIAAVGRLTAEDLRLSSEIYDVEIHYAEIRRKWWGISITHRDGREEKIDAWEHRHKPYKLGKTTDPEQSPGSGDGGRQKLTSGPAGTGTSATPPATTLARAVELPKKADRAAVGSPGPGAKADWGAATSVAKQPQSAADLAPPPPTFAELKAALAPEKKQETTSGLMPRPLKLPDPDN